MLRGVEVRYLRIEKVVFTIITMTRRLQPYFQAHSIKILIDLIPRTLLQRLDTLERMAKWTIELSDFNLSYVPRSLMKAQILVDFIVECTLIDDS